MCMCVYVSMHVCMLDVCIITPIRIVFGHALLELRISDERAPFHLYNQEINTNYKTMCKTITKISIQVIIAYR